MPKALVTGSGGLIGSACVRLLCAEGWDVVGIDNDERAQLFGKSASVQANIESLFGLPGYTHDSSDIREPFAVDRALHVVKPDFIIHAAGQPSHDLAASAQRSDFYINAVGTFNMLERAHAHCPKSPFVFCSTNKVYGDNPNDIQPVMEAEERYYTQFDADEQMPIDQCLHSLFGASKLAADVLCQEYGLYFGMPTGIFRLGCITGPQHAAVELHGYLAYIVQCAVQQKPYTIYGYKGKQVRDQLHADDLARLFLEFYRNPRPGEVYNVGGGRENSISILETIELLTGMGYSLKTTYVNEPRKGDHICYITDLSKVRRDYPEWQITKTVPQMVEEIAARYAR